MKIFKRIEIEVEMDQVEKIAERIAEYIYKAAYNEAIEDVLSLKDRSNYDAVIKLKKE